jgi:hypothetical protein
MMWKPSSIRSAAFLAFCTILLCISVPFVQSDTAYITTIPAYDEECFVIGSPAAGGTLEGNFDHLDDELSPEPLSIVIIDTKEERVMYRSRRRGTSGVFKVDLKPDQKISLCLQNGIITAGRGQKSKSARTHDGEDRVIGFEYTVTPKDENQEAHSQNERNTKAAFELQRGLGNLINHHQYMRMREGKHREIVEKTFNHLLCWVVLEGVTVLGIAGAQIIYFRNFLERRRYM